MSEAPTTPVTESAPPPVQSTPAPEAPATSTVDALFPGGGNDATPAANKPEAAPSLEVVAVPPPTGEGAQPKSEGEDTASAPEAPVYDFKLPESFVADDALMTKAKEVFAANGVSADAAQPLVDLFASAMQAASAAQATALRERETAWLAELNSLPELSGPTREKTSEAIGKLYDVYGSPEAKEAFNASGYGNNPALVKMMVKIANALNEGGPSSVGRPAPNTRDGRPTGRTLSQQLFPDM